MRLWSQVITENGLVASRRDLSVDAAVKSLIDELKDRILLDAVGSSGSLGTLGTGSRIDGISASATPVEIARRVLLLAAEYADAECGAMDVSLALYSQWLKWLR